MTGPYLTIQEACNLAKIGKTKLYKLINQGEIKSYKPSGKRLITLVSLEVWIKKENRRMGIEGDEEQFKPEIKDGCHE